MPFNIRVLDRDEKGNNTTREATPEELAELKRHSSLIDAAVRAEELYSPDDLEYYTELKGPKGGVK